MTVQQIHELLKEKFAEAVLELNETVLQPYIIVQSALIDEIAQYLRDDERLLFDYLMCLSGLDLNENLAVVYHLYSMKHGHQIVLRTEVAKQKPDVKTVAMLWRTADWHEREAFDMFGINFIQHPDLRRILLPDDWQGFPLRKDYVQPEFYNGIRVPHPDQKKEVDNDE
jgi:NADH-quinone oxidoreductase subunit C